MYSSEVVIMRNEVGKRKPLQPHRVLKTEEIPTEAEKQKR
jgi:hypothetical protein